MASGTPRQNLAPITTEERAASLVAFTVAPPPPAAAPLVAGPSNPASRALPQSDSENSDMWGLEWISPVT
jgi:hypothetical protein